MEIQIPRAMNEFAGFVAHTSRLRISFPIVLAVILLLVAHGHGLHMGLASNIAVRGEFAAGWLWQYIEPTIISLEDAPIPMAPMGIAAYGVMEVGGRYFAYNLTTDAVKGVAYIPPDVSVSGYWTNGAYYGQAFSVQLNAFVVAKLKDGAVQYYFIQNFVVFDEKRFEELKAANNIWNTTAEISIMGAPNMRLIPAAVRGNGTVYVCPLCRGNLGLYYYDAPGIIPFGRVELETRSRVDSGEIIVEFYANGRKYDEVAIRPYVPAVSAYIEIAPTTTPTGHPLDLELIFGGYNAIIPYTVLNAGRIRLELYVHMNDSWIPPPSAWSVGYAAVEAAHAGVIPQGVGSALIVPGDPHQRQLWAWTVIVTPFGVNITTSADLSPYARSPIDLGSGARLILAGVYVDGRPAQSLSAVPLGSLVALQYTCQSYCNMAAMADGRGIALTMGIALAFAVAVKSLKPPRADSA